MHQFLGALLALTFALPSAPAPAASSTQERKAPPVEQIIESNTKIAFPVERPADRGVERLDLVGIGLRTKTLFKVKVYAIGLYVDPYAAQEAFADYSEMTTDQLRGSRRFYEQLCEDNCTKSLVLTFARDVGGDDIAEAFSDSIKPRLITAVESKEMPDATEALATFETFFDAKTLKKGSTIEFTWHPENRLTTTVNGVAKPALDSPALCWALFDTYFGTKPIQSKAKERLISTFPTMLAKELPERPAPPAEEPPAEKPPAERK